MHIQLSQSNAKWPPQLNVISKHKNGSGSVSLIDFEEKSDVVAAKSDLFICSESFSAII